MKKIFFALCILVAGCNSTYILNSWKAPDATYSPDKYKKVLILVLAKNEKSRKLAEDKIASKYKALHVSYPVFTMKQLGADTMAVKNMIKEQGYDAALIMRLITTKAKSTFAQGGVNQAYMKNGIYYYPDYINSGTYVTDMDYIVATNFYSLADSKLLWSAVTSSTNPKKIDKVVSQVAGELVYKMKEDKFILEK